MHKLAKGLKKKKKGKKSKHKEEELFKPEELEAYRKEHANPESSAKNEEWRNFLSLTSGVDDILKKTQDDLDRIKSTSFFQRIPPPSETAKKQREAEAQEVAAAAPQPEPEQIGIVPVSESESEEEEEDDIFDTTYIDAIAAGEVKLAYIPESPTDKVDGEDPFDTSYADRAILGPAVEKKGKKLVPLGAAVEVLTGRVQLPTCATTRPVSKRQILKQRDLLLGSFDSGEPPVGVTTSSPEVIKTLLDDDEVPLPDEPIDLSKSLYIPPPPPEPSTAQLDLKKLDDEDDKEFEALAAESLTKTGNVVTSSVIPVATVEDIQNWKPFGETVEADDPFDTTFADNIVPGKAELKLIEKEILDDDFDPRAVKPDIFKDRVPESHLNVITTVHRDLLGGSTSDLSKLGEKPIQPTEDVASEIRYCDPFDTSIVDSVKAPGQAELKVIEKELLGDIKKVPKALSVDEDDFNPRALEASKHKPRTLSRPDVLNVGKTVSFSVPQKDLLAAEDISKVSKPLTPFYARKSSVPGEESDSSDQDPFDTSFVLAPGKVELKIIENEFLNTKVIVEDPDFDPRDESKVARAAAVGVIKDIVNPKPAVAQPVDLLAASNDISVKVLTPAAEPSDSLRYSDPFDTSAACNILPGKAELRILENELIEPKAVGPCDLLVHSGDTIIKKPLTPQPGQTGSVDIDDFDPFDTSFACNLQPGRAELKVLESELI